MQEAKQRLNNSTTFKGRLVLFARRMHVCCYSVRSLYVCLLFVPIGGKFRMRKFEVELWVEFVTRQFSHLLKQPGWSRNLLSRSCLMGTTWKCLWGDLLSPQTNLMNQFSRNWNHSISTSFKGCFVLRAQMTFRASESQTELSSDWRPRLSHPNENKTPSTRSRWLETLRKV